MKITVEGVLVVGLALALVACGGDGAATLDGEELAGEIGCVACHTDTDTDLAPTLRGIWGGEVLLEDGRIVSVDEVYVRKSITDPQADVVAGYEGRMPTFALDPDEVERLVDYVRSLG